MNSEVPKIERKNQRACEFAGKLGNLLAGDEVAVLDKGSATVDA